MLSLNFIHEVLLLEKAEKEVELLLKNILKNTEFANKTHSVGGYVRDEYMGLDPKDLDIVVEIDGGAEKLTKYIYSLFPNKVSTPRKMGAGYPIWQITFKDNIEHESKLYNTSGAVIEFADTMTERFPNPTSRQREISYGTLEDDIARRDFTVNMLLKDLTTGELKDLTGTSREDIEKGILRGHPKVSLDDVFNSDPLRMIRLARFQAKYDWNVPLSVIKIVKRNAERIEIVSAERIMDELKKLMLIGKLSQAIKFMKVSGLLKYILPEVQELKNIQQGIHHQEGDVFKHTLLVLQNAPKTIEGQMAALLHDVGKTQTQEILGDKIQFLGHEGVGEEIARAIMNRLKFDNDTTEKVAKIVRNHMKVHNLYGYGEKALRRFMRDVGDELVDATIDMGEADALGRFPPRLQDKEEYSTLRQRIQNIRTSPVPTTKKPILNGDDIMELLNIKPGRKVKEVIEFVKELEDEYAEKGISLDREIAKQKVIEKYL